MAADLSIEGVVLPYFPPIPALLYIWPPNEHPLVEFYYKINVTVTNQGTADAARFNVSFTVHLEGVIMPEYGRKKTLEGLQQGAKSTLVFDFRPQNYGIYTLTITADCDNDIVELDETNNVRIVTVKGTTRGDCDGDGDVDYNDFLEFVAIYLKRFTSPPYPTADIDWDGDIDYSDFLTFAANYLKTI